MSKNNINIRKIVQALNFFVSNDTNKRMNKMKAYKLLWLADRYHVRQYGRTITNDIYFALPKGAIPSHTKDMLDKKIESEYFDNYLTFRGLYDFSSKSKPNMDVFSETDIEVLHLIHSEFGNKSANYLSKYSHEFPEWKRFEEKLNNKDLASSYKILTDDFFENIKEESNCYEIM
jgi:uncharacterized phage-associated protein